MSEMHPDLHDRSNWTATGAWREGIAITLDDLKSGSDLIERVTSEEWFKSTQGTAAKPAPRKDWKTPVGRTMGFGKHKDRLMADVQEEDPRYWQWCLDEIPSFRAKVAAAGLLDDDSISDSA